MLKMQNGTHQEETVHNKTFILISYITIMACVVGPRSGASGTCHTSKPIGPTNSKSYQNCWPKCIGFIGEYDATITMG
jgi:hypothetical protein